MTVRILTDSTCDLPADLVEELDISVVPLYIHAGGREYQDGVDLTREEFYRDLPSMPEHPTTAAPAPARFQAAYDALAGKGASEVLSIHISSTLSAITQVAQNAARETRSVAVTVFDSRQLSLGTGFLVQRAAELARMGATVRDILPVLEDQVKRTTVAAGIETLKFLRRSGRMNAALSTIGELIQLKPILRMYDGVTQIERIRTSHKALSRMVELVRERTPLERIGFLHSGPAELLQRLQGEVSALLPRTPVLEGMINPAIGAHIGPGAFGFACVAAKVEDP